MKKVAIIYNGQIRTNPLAPYSTRGAEILESLKEHFLNNEFKEKYDYDVFISTDNLDIQNADEFFENKVVNVAFWESNKFLWPLTNEDISPHEELHQRYQDRNFQNCNPFLQQYHQYYRAYLAYKMIKYTGNNYDYFIKIRPDLKLQKSILPIFEELENGKKAFMEHNLFSVASFELLEVYFDLAQFYGKFHKARGDGGNNHGEYPNFCPMDCNAIKFSSEMQETNCFYERLEMLGYTPREHFFGSVYNGPKRSENTYCTFVR